MALPIRRSKTAAQPAPPVSRKLLAGFMFVVLILGYLTMTEREFPTLVIAAISMLGLVGLFALGMKRPEIPLYVMVAYLPFSKLLAGDFGGLAVGLNLTNLLVIIILMCFIANASTEGQLRWEGHALHVPIICYTVWVLVSVIIACGAYGPAYQYRAIPEFKRWLDPIIIYFLFFNVVRDKARWKGVIAILLIGVTLVGMSATWDYMQTSESTSLEKARVGGIADQPNVLGAFFVYYSWIFVAFWLERIKQPKAWGLLAAFLFCVRGLMVTFSRGAYLAFAQAGLGLTFFKNKALFFLATAALAMAILNPVLLPPGIRYRIESTFNQQSDTQLADVYTSEHPEQELDKSAGMRLIIWTGAVEMIKEYPVFGVGISRFQVMIAQYTNLAKFIDAHNAYILTAAEFGIPALILFLLIVLCLFGITASVRRHSDPFIRSAALGFLAGLTGLLMANMFGSRLNSTEVSGYFWILAALMARAQLWTKEEQRQIKDAERLRRRKARIAAGMA